MTICRVVGCGREVGPWYRHCCSSCYGAYVGGYPPDEHTPECNLRHAAAGDYAVRKWVAIYDQVATLSPAYEEAWRHLKRSFYATDVGVLEQSEWDSICGQLRQVRRGEGSVGLPGWLRMLFCGGLCINLETGETNYTDHYPDFRVKFPEAERDCGGGSDEV